MILSLLKSKLGLLFFSTILLVVVLHGLFTKIQENSKVLGATSHACSSKLDLNCDQDTNLTDAKVLYEYALAATIKKPSPTPTPTTCGNGKCESSESAKKLSKRL